MPTAFRGPVLFRPFLYPPIWLLMLLPFGLLAVGHGLWRLHDRDGRGARPRWKAGATGGAGSPSSPRPPPSGWCWPARTRSSALPCFYGGLRLLDRSPAAAGILLGLAGYKPQIWVLVPLALLAARQWRALAWTAGTVAVLSLASLGVFGLDFWLAFLDAAREAGSARVANEMFERIFMHMTTLLAAARILGLPPASPARSSSPAPPWPWPPSGSPSAAIGRARRAPRSW